MKNMLKKVTGGLVAIGSTLMTAAHAALPTGIDTALATVQSDALSLADIVWPIVIALFGSVVMFKLFKRYASKI